MTWLHFSSAKYSFNSREKQKTLRHIIEKGSHLKKAKCRYESGVYYGENQNAVRPYAAGPYATETGGQQTINLREKILKIFFRK